jgi:DNA-binding NarL/FixJ family response regulator
VTPPAAYRVVLADDVAQLRGLLRLLLERSGRFEVVAEAANGREAVDVTTRERPHLTLLDLSMPVMDGLEALPLIRAAVPSCALVVLSGFDADRMADTALAAGAAAYLVKGIRPDDLVARLLELLEGGGGEERGGGGGSGPGDGDIALQLPRDPSSAPAAREFIRRTLLQWRHPALVDDALLMATELVTNAVVHAESDVNVRVLAVGERIRIEVADSGGGALRLRPPSTESLGGRGLLLVEALSRTWGTSAGQDKKVVWFEL